MEGERGRDIWGSECVFTMSETDTDRHTRRLIHGHWHIQRHIENDSEGARERWREREI